MNQLFIFFANTPKQFAIVLINVYQVLISPDHSWLKGKYPYGYCRHYPSCSEYSKLAISRLGLTRGGWLGLKRVLKCHPWSEPKVDLVPRS